MGQNSMQIWGVNGSVLNANQQQKVPMHGAEDGAVFVLGDVYQPRQVSSNKKLTVKDKIIVCFKNGYDPDNETHRAKLKSVFSNSSITAAKNSYSDDPERFAHLDKYTIEDLGLDIPPL